MLRAAVERQCEIIGEALTKLAWFDPPLAGRISEHRRIIAFRNILIHGYADVDHRLVWDVVTTKVVVSERRGDGDARRGLSAIRTGSSRGTVMGLESAGGTDCRSPRRRSLIEWGKRRPKRKTFATPRW